MQGRLYVSLGLPLDTWKAVDTAKESLIFRDVLGRYPTTSDAVDLLVKYGSAYLRQLEAKEQEVLA